MKRKQKDQTNKIKKMKKTCSQKIFEFFKYKSKNSENEIENKLLED